MSEFKFACPVCGQHITADSHAAGSQLACPTCFRKIVVPQAPGSAERKFILSAAEVDKPRPQLTETPSFAAPAGSARHWDAAVYSAIGLLILAAAAAGVFLVRKHAASAPAPHPSNTVVVEEYFPPPTNQLPWTLDLAEVKCPEESASGRIHDRDFLYERATLQGGNLTLRHGHSGPIDLGLSIYFFTRHPHELSGKTLTVTTNNTRSPRVVLRWKNYDKTSSQTIRSGYALKVDFGNIVSNRIAGQIYICLPDKSRSCVAGVFDAEIRAPSPPKPRGTNLSSTN